MLQCLCLLPNRHLLIEGGLFDLIVEVYEIMMNAGTISQPLHTIKTGCRGLSAIETTNDRIYMGFMGTLIQPNCIV